MEDYEQIIMWVVIVVILALLIFLVLKFRERLWVAIVKFPRDFKTFYIMGRILYDGKKFERQNSTALTIFKSRVDKEPQRPCLYFEDKMWTVLDVEEYSNRVAQVFLAAGYKKDDVVALFMGNCPEYVCIWLGLAKLGVVTSLINSNLRSYPLIHSLTVVKAKAVIFSDTLSLAMQEVVKSLDYSLEQYQLGGEPGSDSDVKSLDALITKASISPPNVEEPGYGDKLLYIYTSGTTGLPKAAIILHSRFLLMIIAAKYIIALHRSDVIYNSLPLYHTAGGIIGIGHALVLGNGVVITRKFSASGFWPDCIKYNCTAAQYIGEMCRYILTVPPRPEDTQHNVKVIFGNGLRSTIWKAFVERFKVKRIVEGYASTEGNANAVNICNKIGAIGHFPRGVPRSVLPVGLIRVDPTTDEPIRGKNGLCIPSDVDEPGMMVGQISSHNPMRHFHGYADKSASSKKILHNVFKKGDKYFSTGDILIMDKYGYLYFKDRTGDTFRWKGENVSTAEVDCIIMNIIGLKDATVYGVEIPGHEGRAGMVAIADPENNIDFAALAEGVDKSLPSYARPIFIRIVNQLHMTETFKIKKYELQKEGLDPAKTGDNLYFRSEKTYVPLTAQMYQDILKGVIRI